MVKIMDSSGRVIEVKINAGGRGLHSLGEKPAASVPPSLNKPPDDAKLPPRPVNQTPPQPVPRDPPPPQPPHRAPHPAPKRDRYGYYEFDEFYRPPPSVREMDPDIKWWDPDNHVGHTDWDDYPGPTPFYGGGN